MQPIVLDYNEEMRSPWHPSKSQLLNSAAWGLVTLGIITAMLGTDHSRAIARQGANPFNPETANIPLRTKWEVGLLMAGVFAADATAGATIGALTGDQFMCAILGVFFSPFVLVAYGFLFGPGP